MPAPRLVSPRLCLREWEQGDLPGFDAMNADARVMRLLQGPLTPEESAASLSRITATWLENGWGLFAVERRGDSAFLGFCGVAPVTFDADFEPKIEIGWRLAYEHWGYGYVTEAAHHVIDWVFSALAWPEVVSFTREENARSRAVMDRLGMVREPEHDFDLPSPPRGEGGPRHVFYRLKAADWFRSNPRV